MKRTNKRFVWIAVISVMSFMVALLCLFAVRPFRVVGDSMNPTYTHNDFVFVNVIATKYSVDDVIVIQYGNKKIIKRIYAECGDVVDITAEGIYINDLLITANDKRYEETRYCLGKNEYFVLGDNFDQSVDSRYFGIIADNEIVGKVFE